MTWLEGRGLLAFKDAPQETRDSIAACCSRPGGAR